MDLYNCIISTTELAEIVDTSEEVDPAFVQFFLMSSLVLIVGSGTIVFAQAVSTKIEARL
jgi:hypothetical protein